MPAVSPQISRLDHCWWLPKNPPLFIQLGRTGDLLLLFPAFKLIYDRTGMKPHVIVSNVYANIFEGISYAVPNVITGHWYNDMPKARALAEKMSINPIIPQWWQPGVFPRDVPPGPMILQSHGLNWGVDTSKYPDFGTSMWARAGFTRQEMIAAPLVIDRRNPMREEVLFKQHVTNNKPLLLYNFTGISSPFGYVPEMMKLLSPYQLHFNLVDIGHIRAFRIFDLLGLYDKAVGLITIDTSTAHLAPASKVPTIWFTVPNWGSSVPRGNVALHVSYNETPKRLNEIQAVLEKWKAASA